MSTSQPRDKEKLRQGYASIPAKDFRDGGVWEVLLSDENIRAARYLGMQLASELAFIVPEVLSNPTAIFMGIRWDADEDRQADVPAWLCYVGQPRKSFGPAGEERPPYEDEVYLVFVNAERVAYHYRWEKCCPDNAKLPIGHSGPGKSRFARRVL